MVWTGEVKSGVKKTILMLHQGQGQQRAFEEFRGAIMGVPVHYDTDAQLVSVSAHASSVNQLFSEAVITRFQFSHPMSLYIYTLIVEHRQT